MLWRTRLSRSRSSEKSAVRDSPETMATFPGETDTAHTSASHVFGEPLLRQSARRSPFGQASPVAVPAGPRRHHSIAVGAEGFARAPTDSPIAIAGSLDATARHTPA